MIGERCPTCGQIIPKPAQLPLPPRELVALSAWWAAGSYSAGAMLAGVELQTLKNQLYRARIRNGVHTTAQLVAMYLGQLLSQEQLVTSHNQRTKEARRAA